MSDLISRQDAIDAIFGRSHEIIKARIEKLPSAQLERKKGEWLFNPTDAIEMMFTKPKCSECGFESADGGNFCPNCGAYMRKEVE